MKVNELLDEGWKANVVGAAAVAGLALGTAALAPKAEIGGQTYDLGVGNVTSKMENPKHGTAVINGKKTKVIYGIVKSAKRTPGKDREYLYVKDDQ
jgi:hypothetical protein